MVTGLYLICMEEERLDMTLKYRSSYSRDLVSYFFFLETNFCINNIDFNQIIILIFITLRDQDCVYEKIKNVKTHIGILQEIFW